MGERSGDCGDGRTGTDNKYLKNLIWKNKQGIVLQNGVVDVGTINADPRLVNYQPTEAEEISFRIQAQR